jgi:hypothetical protein
LILIINDLFNVQFVKRVLAWNTNVGDTQPSQIVQGVLVWNGPLSYTHYVYVHYVYTHYVYVCYVLGGIVKIKFCMGGCLYRKMFIPLGGWVGIDVM